MLLVVCTTWNPYNSPLYQASVGPLSGPARGAFFNGDSPGLGAESPDVESPLEHTAKQHPPATTASPFHRLCLDSIGPLRC